MKKFQLLKWTAEVREKRTATFRECRFTNRL